MNAEQFDEALLNEGIFWTNGLLTSPPGIKRRDAVATVNTAAALCSTAIIALILTFLKTLVAKSMVALLFGSLLILTTCQAIHWWLWQSEVTLGEKGVITVKVGRLPQTYRFELGQVEKITIIVSGYGNLEKGTAFRYYNLLLHPVARPNKPIRLLSRIKSHKLLKHLKRWLEEGIALAERIDSSAEILQPRYELKESEAQDAENNEDVENQP